MARSLTHAQQQELKDAFDMFDKGMIRKLNRIILASQLTSLVSSIRFVTLHRMP
jgi:Ca2+-binding EF-hand superfamily protein